MNNRIKRTLAAVCAVAAVCTTFGMNPVLPDFRIAATVASAASVGQPFTSGDCSGSFIQDDIGGVQLYYKVSGSKAIVTGLRNGSLRAAIVEGNASLSSSAFGGNASVSNPKMTIYGNTDTNPCPTAPYVKVNKSTAYDSLMDKVEPYFMGIQAGPNRFAHEGGCCAGMAILQNLVMTDRLTYPELFPMPYQGQPVTSFLQVPDDAYTAGRPEFVTFSNEVYDYWHDQYDYLDFGYKLKLDRNTLDCYAKLTEYGVPMPGYVEVKPCYNHAFTFLGIQKLDTPVTKLNGIDGRYHNYDYRMIVSENGYRFKLDENGKLIARGNDKHTWWEGIAPDEGWAPVEDTYLYISTEDDSLPFYAQRWNDPLNVKSHYRQLGLKDISVIYSAGVSKKAD